MTSATSARTVLLGGYNIIHRHRPWQRLPLEEARRQLLQAAQAVRWPFAAAPRLVVVFDGPGSDRLHPSARLQVLFDPSADAAIQALIRRAAHPEQLVLISDDGELVRTAKAHRALQHSAAWFLERAGCLAAPAPRSTRRAARPDPSSGDPGPSAADARRITEELAARWLKRKPS